MKKKLVATMLAMALCVTSLYGCGSGGKKEESKDSDKKTESSANNSAGGSNELP